MFRPGLAILVNFPNCSISATVPVFTVTQGKIPHDIAGAVLVGEVSVLGCRVRDYAMSEDQTAFATRAVAKADTMRGARTSSPVHRALVLGIVRLFEVV